VDGEGHAEPSKPLHAVFEVTYKTGRVMLTLAFAGCARQSTAAPHRRLDVIGAGRAGYRRLGTLK
jgi:hypothetical protein